MDTPLNATRVIEQAESLPAFPQVVTDILGVLDNDSAGLRKLAGYVERDPVITAKIFAQVNSAAARTRTESSPRDVYTAISLIGLTNVRRIVLAHSTISFLKNLPNNAYSSHFWEHSVAVGICAQELARTYAVSSDYALVAGLLHDVGQLWMTCFYPEQLQRVHNAIVGQKVSIIDAERAEFNGLDHATIGQILAGYWGLPEPVTAAIQYHHAPDLGLPNNLVAITHVAEVISNALDLTKREENQVSTLSERACEELAIDWEEDMARLFGEIEARTEYACAGFRHT
jgi:putative nucleotidyltransferase with HDIG domain